MAHSDSQENSETTCFL